MATYAPNVSFFSRYRKSITVISINLLIIIIFGIIYGFYLKNNEDDWSIAKSSNPWLNGMYASVIAHTSVGFGDIYPTSIGAKLLVVFQALLAFLFNLYQGLA